MTFFFLGGSVKGRYEIENPTPTPVNVKIERNGSEESDNDNDEEPIQSNEDDSDEEYLPATRNGRKSGRVKEVRVKIIHQETKKSARKRSSATDVTAVPESKRSRSSKNCGSVPATTSKTDSSTGNISSRDPSLKMIIENPIDSERLNELTSSMAEVMVKAKTVRKGGKRESLNLMQKMEVIRMIDSGVKKAEIARKLNLRSSSVWQISNDREKIETAFNAGAPLRKRIVRRGAFSDVNDAVYQWYEKVKTQNLFVNSRVLLTMAENIANELGRTDFVASPNWLTRFKDRYNVRFTSPRPKPMKVKTEAVDGGGEVAEDNSEVESKQTSERVTVADEDEWVRQDWLKNTWSQYRIKNTKNRELYPERDVFFVEEVGILYRITPKQAWKFKTAKSTDRSQDFSISDERLTVVLCANADASEKRKLLIIGQSQPNDIPKNLPAEFVTSMDPSNWITKTVFARWARQWNDDLVKQGRKVILICNSSPVHIHPYNFSNIRIVNLPTRVLSTLHPVNHGVSMDFKVRYRRLLLEKMIAYGGLKAVTDMDAVLMLSTAWNELSGNTIQAAFMKAGYVKNNKAINVPTEDFDCTNLLLKAAELDLAVAPTKYSFMVRSIKV